MITTITTSNRHYNNSNNPAFTTVTLITYKSKLSGTSLTNLILLYVHCKYTPFDLIWSYF